MTPEYDRTLSDIPPGSSSGGNRSKRQDEVLWLKAQRNVRKWADVQLSGKFCRRWLTAPRNVRSRDSFTSSMMLLGCMPHLHNRGTIPIRSTATEIMRAYRGWTTWNKIAHLGSTIRDFDNVGNKTVCCFEFIPRAGSGTQHLEGHVSIDGAGVGHAPCRLLLGADPQTGISSLSARRWENHTRPTQKHTEQRVWEDGNLTEVGTLCFSCLSLEEWHSSTFSDNQGTAKEDWEILVYCFCSFILTWKVSRDTKHWSVWVCVCVVVIHLMNSLRLGVIITHHGLVVDLLHEMSQHQDALQGGVHVESLRWNWEL